MLGIPQDSPGACPCPQQEQPASVIATPVHGQATLQQQPVIGPMAGELMSQPTQSGPPMQPQSGGPGPYLGAKLSGGRPPRQPQGAMQLPQAPEYPQGMPPPTAPTPEEIQIIVMGAPNEFLAHWLMINGLQWRRAVDSYDCDVSRNRATREFLAHDVPKGKRYMVMFDADMVPCGETQALLTATGDLVFCGHVGAQGGRGHSGPGNFAAACFRVSLRCLQKIGDVSSGVWWNMGKDPSRSERTHCECAYFNHTARAAGFAPVQVGVIGHMQTCIIFPVNNSPEQWKLIWPTQYRHMIPQGVAAAGGP